MINKVLFSSRSEEWSTPRELFDSLNKEFNFTLAPCASKENTKCKNFFTKGDNGLNKDWDKNMVFMNPPYGKNIGLWMTKAVSEANNGATIICLIPARTDTKWWHETVEKYASFIRFIKGRVKFDGGKYSSTFPSVIVGFMPYPNTFEKKRQWE